MAARAQRWENEQLEIREGRSFTASGTRLRVGPLSKVKFGSILDGALQPTRNIP